jgi:hypothetical protein
VGVRERGKVGGGGRGRGGEWEKENLEPQFIY